MSLSTVPMIVLGIETSGVDGSVALLRDGICLGERQMLRTGRRHAQSLVLEIGQLLAEHRLRPFDVNLVAVSRGPGSFTGLRVGMTCAKTFAYATECPFTAIDTFLAIAENVPAGVNRILVIEDAQRDDLYAGEYVRDQTGRWTQTNPIGIISVEQFCINWKSGDFVTGPGVRKLDSEFRIINDLTDESIRLPQASVIARLGQSSLTVACVPNAPDENRDLWRASPFYMRPSAAEEKRAAMMPKE